MNLDLSVQRSVDHDSESRATITVVDHDSESRATITAVDHDSESLRRLLRWITTRRVFDDCCGGSRLGESCDDYHPAEINSNVARIRVTDVATTFEKGMISF